KFRRGSPRRGSVRERPFLASFPQRQRSTITPPPQEATPALPWGRTSSYTGGRLDTQSSTQSIPPRRPTGAEGTVRKCAASGHCNQFPGTVAAGQDGGRRKPAC